MVKQPACPHCGEPVMLLVGFLCVNTPSVVHEVELHVCPCRVAFEDKSSGVTWKAVVTERKSLEPPKLSSA